MNHFIRIFGYLLGANGQAVFLLIGSAYLVPYLEERFPQNFEWSAVVWPLAVAAVIHSYFIIIRAMIRLEQRRPPTDPPDEAS